MRARRVSMVAVMAAVMATGVSVSVTGNVAGAALVRPYPIYHVTPFLFPDNEILAVDNVSSDGRFAVVQNTFGPRHVALPSGVTSGGAPGGVSNVNFGPGTVDPNFAMTRVGDDGRVCFTNSVHGEVDVVIDAQVIGDADAFRLPSADGSVRILDTREAGP